MEKTIINAEKRTTIGKKVKTLRRQGKLPAVIYGEEIASTAITLDHRETTRLFTTLTSSSLVTIVLDGKEHLALIHEKQIDFITRDLLHVDFRTVKIGEKLQAPVSIALEGVAPAIKEYDCIVVTNLDQLHVECLPKDLPERISVDISNLYEIGDSVLVKDIDPGDNVDVLNAPEDIVVVVVSTAQMVDEIEEMEEGEVEVDEDVSEPEVIERGKREEGEEEE